MGVFCVNTTSKEFKDASKRLNIHPSSLEVCVHLFLNSSFAKEQLDTTGQLPFPSDNYIREFFSLGNTQSGREAIDNWIEDYGATDGRVTDKQFLEVSLEYPKEALHSYLDAQGNKVNIVSRPTINTLKDLKYFLQKLNIIDDNENLLGITADRFYERMNALAIPASLYMHFDKELKKQISLLFKLNPELAEVGTEEQYLQYLAGLNENGNLNLRNFIARDTQNSLFNSDGTINWETFESLTNNYYDKQADSMFSHGRYTLATRPENHFTGEKNTLNHIKFVTQSMLDLLEGKFDKDLPFVSEARASLKNQRDLMVLAAMFHDAAKPYRHGDIHGWESADILRDIIGLNYNNRVAEWAVRHHMPMPFAHKAEFSLSNPDALEVAKNIARDARRVGIDAATAINAFVLINAADIINGRELNVDDNWAKKAMAEGPTKYGNDISVKNVLSIELKEKVDLLKQSFKEIENEDFGNTVFNYTNQQRFDYTEFPEGGRKDGRLPYLSNTTNVLLPGSSEDVNQFAEFVGNTLVSPNNEEFAEDDNNILFQKQPITIQTRKLWTINRTLKDIGSADSIRALLNSKEIDPVITNTILDAISKEPKLKELKPLEVFNIVRRALETGLAKDYNNYIQQPIIEELESLLLDYLKPLHVESIEDEVAEKYGVTGLYDILNKVIHLAKNRNAITVTEEFAHAFVELMGARVSGRPENADYTFLYNTIEGTSIYKQVYEQYKDTYTVKNDKGETVPDIKKIKKEAIGQALAVAINNKWQETHAEEEKGFWEKLKEWFNSILDYFNNLNNRVNKFLDSVDEEGYIDINELLDKIATEVLHKDYTRLNKVNSKNYNLLDYTETIAEQTKKDGGKALEFMQWYSSIGNIITGSLAYRKQGTVYRPAIESLHDIDMVVPVSVHNIDFQDAVMQVALLNKGTQLDTIPFLLNTEYFKRVLEKYPDLQITAAYTDNKGGLIVNSLWSKNRDLILKFEELTGTYADRLVHFTQEERDLMYLFDFFLEPTDAAESFTEESTGITLSKYPRIFKSKLALGRAKDIFDYLMWDLFEEFKANNLSEEEYLMFQKPIQYNPEQQEAIRLVGEFIADRNAKEDFFLISGKAGTGKTTIINEIVNNEANRLGYIPNVFITAIANKAVLNLDAKIEAPHVKKATASALGFFESVKDNGEKTWRKPKNWSLDKLPISRANILFIDECSMLDTAKLDMILQIKQQLPNLKIVMIGDRGLIHSIEDNKDSDNTLVSDEDKEGFAPSIVFTYKNKKEAQLLTRVRQGEESPVLGFADIFWEAATSGKKDLPSEAKEKTIISPNGAVIRYKDASSTVNEGIAQNLLPSFEKAREDGNPNHIKIVAVHKELVQRYNDLIYGMMHPDETSPYNPLHAGDMIMFYAPFGTEEDDLGNQIAKYYNSSELVVKKAVTAPYKADLSNIIDMLHKFAPKIDTTPFENIMVQDIEVEYNGKPDTITVICPSLDNTETLMQLGIKLGKLANEFFRDGKINLGGMFLGLRTSLERKIADVRLNYAISAHKSQGSTYDIVVVDSKDIRGGRVKGEKYNNGNPRATWGGFAGPGERAAIMYTAITRASNVTVVLHGTTGETASLDIESINEAITLNKKGNPVVMPQATQPKKQLPETKPEQPSQNEDTEWNKVQGDWDAIFEEHNDHIEFIDTADKHEYWYYPNGKDDSENKQKMDITVTGLTNPVQGRNAWLDVSGNIGTSADRVVRDFFMGIDVLDRKYPNFTKEQLKTLVDNLNNFKKFLDKEFAGTKYKVVTNPFSLVGKVTKYNGTTQTVGGTVDILIYDEEGGYMIYDIKTTRKDDLRGTDTLQHYESQVNLYRELLEAMHSQLKGKCLGLGILQLHTFYSTPQGLRAQGATGTTVYSIDKATNQIQADGVSIENHEKYEAPHFPDNDVQKAVIPFESFTAPKQYYLTGSPKPLTISSLNSKPAKETSQVQTPVSTGSAAGNVKKATTRKVKGKDITFSANMYEQYEDDARDGISSETTLDAIVAGERTATTRWNYIEGFYDQIKEGDIVEFHDKNGRSILVKVTKAPHLLTAKDSAEEWSEKEGWSVDYYKREVKSHVRAGEAYQMEFEYVEDSFVDENTPSRSRISVITISLEKDKYNYRKGYPQKHTDTAFIFTENALANAANLGIAPIGPRPSKITLDVNAQGRSGGFNQADIRTDEDGDRTENAFGLVVKKYQQSKEGRWVKQEGCFEDTETDFLIFMKANLQMFARLEDSEYDKMVFPFEIALGKAALPKRFANWLKNQLEARYGIITEIEKNKTPGYKGYGLRVQEVIEDKKAPEIKGENISSRGSEFAKKLTNYGNTVSVEFKGKTYRNAEHAYQTWKSGEFDEAAYNSTAAKPKGSKAVNKKVSDSIMVDILTAKLQQHPELVKGITDRGGIAYLKASTHDVIGDLHWETKNGEGDNGFINALTKAYQQVSKEEVLFDEDGNPLGNNPEFNSHFTLSSGDYAQRTDENAEWADVTLALAEDFTTAGEIRTARAAGATVENKAITDKGDSYVSEKIDKRIFTVGGVDKIAESLYRQIVNTGKVKNIKLNIAGNGIYSLDGYSQESLNERVTMILQHLLDNGVTISEIRSGGQTGIDEAGIIAALKLGIKWSVNAPSGWKFRVSEDTFESEYEDKVSEGSFKKNRDGSYDISDEKLFKERFGLNAEDSSNQSQEDYNAQQDAELEDKLATVSVLPISQPINPEEEFSKRELALIKQTRNLVELSSDIDTLFKPSELKSWAKACMFLVSDMVSVLNSSETRKDEFFRYLDNETLREQYMQMDFTKMDRIEILSKLGDNAFRIIRNKYFNAANNLNSDNFKRKTLKKLAAINDNFDAFLEMGRATLAKIENVSDTGNVRRILVDDSEDVVEGEDAETLAEIAGSSIEAWQVNFRGLSAHSSLSLMVKRAIETCYDYDENGNKKLNEIGIPERVNSALAVNNILMWTQGAETLGQMVEILKEKQEEHPWLSQLIAKLDESSQDETFKSQFYSNFKKYFQPYIIQYVKETKDPTGRVISTQLMNKVINLNALEKQLLEQYRAAWQNRNEDKINLANLDGTMDSSSVDIIANAVSTLRDFLDGLDEDEENVNIPKNIMQIISDVYWVFDIELDSQLMDKLDNIETVRSIYKNLVYLSKNLNRNKDKADYDVVKNNEKNLQALFSYIVDSSLTTLESVAYEDGKLHYSYVTPSYLSKLIEKLKGNTEDYEAFMEKEYGLFPWFKNADGEWRNEWLRLLNENEETKENLQHAVVLTSQGVGYRDKSPLLYAKSMLLNYFYGGANSLWAFYRVPMLSNKPSEEYIRFRRYIDSDYQEEISRLLMNVAYQEIDRILTCRQRKNSDVAHIKSFDKNGQKFMFLDYLQEYLDEYLKWKEKHPKGNVDKTNGALLLGKMLNDRIEGVQNLDREQFEDLLQKYISENMNERFKDYMRYLLAEGVLELDEDGDYIHLADLKIDGTNGRSIEENLLNFFWNDTFAAINILQLTVTDIAYYKDAEDLQKRLAQIHAPGLRANLDAKWNGVKVVDDAKKTRTIYINDFDNVVSDAIANIEQIFENKARRAANPQLAKEIREQAKHIISAFKQINVTDALGYSSPSSYRKKAIIFGKWSDELEEVYQKIRGGRYNTRDLEVMMQPLKPFVYSNTTKESVGRLNKLKVGMQNKNSEYLLLMMDAILQGEENTGNPRKSKLAAIYKVMEDSHYESDGVTYKPDGIDTVLFNSTVKAGEMGVIDINSATTTQEAIDIMENAIYVGGDAINGYNPDTVHELDFEDYCIQNEVPAHLEGTSIFGSQMRILSISDMPEIVNNEEQFVTFRGLRTSLRQLKQNYVNACAANIYQSLEELRKQFKLEGTRAQKNIALSRILQEQIDNDARFGFDLKYAVMTDEQGNFNIPISDPIQAGRIQQLLNSVIKTRINKQQIEGGPVVQVTNFGTSSELNIIFKDADGNALLTLREFYDENSREYSYEEFLNMAHYENSKDASKRKLYNEYYRPIIDEYNRKVGSKQAGIMYFECYAPSTVFQEFADDEGVVHIEDIPEEMLEIIGFRIPTEFKYSMAPLKIVGLLPSEAGEGIMLPKEITTLSGSDFDIDKLYIIRPVVQFNIWEVRKDYRKLLKKTYDTKAIWDDIYLNFPEIDELIEQIQHQTYEQYKQDQNLPDLKFEDFLEIAKTTYGKKRKLDWIPNASEVFEKITKQWDDMDDYVIDHGIQMSFKEFKEQAKKQAKYYTKVTDMNTKRGRDNLIFDSIWSILTSEQAMDQIFTPGNFDMPKKYGYMAAVLEMYDKKSLVKYLINDKSDEEKETLREKYKDMSLYDIVDSLDTNELKAAISKNKNLVYNHVHLQFHKQNMVAGKLIGIFAQNNVSHGVISLIDQTAKLDSQGNPQRDANGKVQMWKPMIELPEDLIIINKKIIGGLTPYDTLQDLEGNRISNTLAAFLAASVDAVKDPVLNYMNVNQVTAGILTSLVRMGYNIEMAMLLLTQPVVKEFVQEFNIANEGDNYKSFNALINEKIEKIIEENSDASIDEDIVPEISKSGLIATLKNRTAESDVNLLKAIQALNQVSDVNSAIISITKFNSVTSALGPMLSNTILLRNRIENNLANEALQTESMQKALSNPIITAFRDATFTASDEIFSGLMLQGSVQFASLVGRVESMIRGRMTDKEVNRLADFYMAFMLTKGNQVFKTASNKKVHSKERRQEILEKLPNRVKQAKKNTDNKLLKRLEIRAANDSHSHRWLFLNTRGMSGDISDEIGASWLELYLENPKLAMDLIEYNFYISGLGFNPNTFSNLIPVALRALIPNYIELLNPENSLNSIEIDRLIDQFFRNNYGNRKLVPDINKVKDIVWKNGSLLIDAGTSAIQMGDTVVPYVSYRNRIFKFEKDFGNKVKYILVTELGGKKNEILEINAKSDIESVFDDEFYHPRKEDKKAEKGKEKKETKKTGKNEKLEIEVEGKSKSKVNKTRKPTANTFISQIQYFILTQVDDQFRDERINTLWRSTFAAKNNQWAPINALKSLFNDTLGKGVYDKEVFGQMKNIAYIVQAAVKGIREDKVNLKSLEKLINSIKDTENDLNICG